MNLAYSICTMCSHTLCTLFFAVWKGGEREHYNGRLPLCASVTPSVSHLLHASAIPHMHVTCGSRMNAMIQTINGQWKHEHCGLCNIRACLTLRLSPGVADERVELWLWWSHNNTANTGQFHKSSQGGIQQKFATRLHMNVPFMWMRYDSVRFSISSRAINLPHITCVCALMAWTKTRHDSYRTHIPFSRLRACVFAGEMSYWRPRPTVRYKLGINRFVDGTIPLSRCFRLHMFITAELGVRSLFQWGSRIWRQRENEN